MSTHFRIARTLPRFVAPAGVSYDALWTATGLLYAAWKLDETSGTSAADSAGTNTGTIASTGVTYGTTGTTGLGKGLTFDGSSGEVQCPFGLDLADAGGLALAFKTTDTSNPTILIRTNNNAPGQGSFVDIAGSNVQVRANGSTHTVSGISGTALNDGNIHLLVLQADGTTVEFWFDGVLIDSWANTSTWQMICTASIGTGSPHHLFRSGTGTGASSFYTGTAYDYRIFSGSTLNSTQQAALASAALT